MKAAVFDIGGTFVKHSVYQDGFLKDMASFPTCGQDGADALIGRIRNVCSNIADMDAIGICTRGQVNCGTGEIIYDPPHLIPGYTGKNLKAEFSSFGVPIAIENDANCMAIAESAALGINANADILCLTYGTCVGGAIVRGGAIYHGVNWSAGEFGMMYMNGEYYENIASVTRLVEQAKAMDASLCDGRTITANLDRSDVHVLVDGWAKQVAEGLASLIHIFNPACMIIGGGIMENKDVFNMVTSKVSELTAPGFDVNIHSARFGNSAGLIGAGILSQKLMK